MAFPDLGKKGNLGGIVVGAEPYLGNLDGVGKIDNDTSLHIEGFYKHQLTDNIAVTPGVIWITAPNQNKENEDIVTGVVRMTFTF
jgi:carbohydrate-selective porin OprB